jgi:hypothetical protein
LIASAACSAHIDTCAGNKSRDREFRPSANSGGNALSLCWSIFGETFPAKVFRHELLFAWIALGNEINFGGQEPIGHDAPLAVAQRTQSGVG